MNILCKTRTSAPTSLLYRLRQNEQIQYKNKWKVIACCYRSGGNLTDKTHDPNFIQVGSRPNPKVEKHALSMFQKRLLYFSGKYPTMAAVPHFAGESELRNATDICKTLFNIWCMMFLACFAMFLHFIEKRRMRRAFARIERKEQRRMQEFDKVNKEAQEKIRLKKELASS